MGRRTNTAVWLDTYKRWQLNVQKDGVRRTFTSSTPGRNGQREANAKADAWLDENISNSSTRIELLYGRYVDELKVTTSEDNWKKADAFGRNWILPAIGKRKISTITEQSLQEIINSAFADGKAKKTLENLRATIASFLKYCRKCKATTLFPENFTIPRGATVGQKRILQPEDLAKLFTVDTTRKRGKTVFDEHINAYRFQVLTGLRPGELLGLKWSDIKGRTVYIRRSRNVHNTITTGKNDNAIRHFVMSKLTSSIVESQRLLCPDSEYVFGGVCQSTYSKSWTRYCEANKLPHISPYEMRHTFVSVAKNLPDGAVKPLVGHAKNMDTFGTYGHEVRGELTKLAEQLDNLFTEILQSTDLDDA